MQCCDFGTFIQVLGQHCNVSSSFPLHACCRDLRWHVRNGGHLSGNSCHSVQVLKIHSLPLSSTCVSCHTRPRLSTAAAAPERPAPPRPLFTSQFQRPLISTFGDHRAFPEFHQIAIQMFLRPDTGLFYELGVVDRGPQLMPIFRWLAHRRPHARPSSTRKSASTSDSTHP